MNPPRPVYLNGKVLMEQGAAPPESVVVVETCSGRVRARTYTDSHGNFTVSPSQGPTRGFDPGTITAADAGTRESAPKSLEWCELRADLAGFTSTELQVRLDDNSFSGMRDIGTIFIRPIGGTAQGATISVTSLQVPANARSEYNKGIDAIRKDKLKPAQEHLQKAVEIYPNYAAAWVALGQLYEHRQSADDARNAYSHANTADPHYLSPYLHLAVMAARDRQWEQVVTLTARAIELDPVDYFQPYFLNAAAQFNLQRLPEAETAALKAADLDSKHQGPRIQFLLAQIYAAKGDHAAEANQLRAYLKLAPDAPDAAMARASLERIEQKK